MKYTDGIFNKLNTLAEKLKRLDSCGASDFMEIIEETPDYNGTNGLIGLADLCDCSAPMAVMLQNANLLGGDDLVTIALPTARERIQPLLDRMNVGEAGRLDIVGVSSRVPYLSRAVLECRDNAYFDELNVLAAKVRDLDGSGREALGTVFKAMPQVAGISEITKMVENHGVEPEI